MKNLIAALLVLMLAVAPALAYQEAKGGAGKTHEIKAEFVSGDPDAKTVTVKAGEGGTQTFPIEGKAIEALKSLKAGDQVVLTCRDDDKGAHQAIVSIEKAKAGTE